MNANIEQILGGMSLETFLRDYWQKKPLVVEGAFKNTSQLASFENLKEMGEDENFYTRMVWSAGGNRAWEAQKGPFNKKQFTYNNKDKWTLLVHNLELYFKEFREIKDLISFIPTWQFDDIMATYSVEGASVGAHIDNYNVFIFQGRGNRLWQINEKPDHTYIEGLDIRLLKNFEVEYEVKLAEGDMIYIPPGVAHHGVSLDENISYSIGFKAFDCPDIAGSFCSEFLSDYDSSDCLNFKTTSLAKNIHEFTDQDINIVREFFAEKVLTDENLVKWFGGYITTSQEDGVAEDQYSLDKVLAMLKDKLPLYRDTNMKFSFYKTKEDSVKLFINGVEYNISTKDYEFLEPILNTPGYEPVKITQSGFNSLANVLIPLMNHGILFFDEN